MLTVMQPVNVWMSLIWLFIFSSGYAANLLVSTMPLVPHHRDAADLFSSTTPLVRNQYRACYIRDEVWGGVRMVACGSKAWALHVQQRQEAVALIFSCHIMGRDPSGFQCCPLGEKQIGCVLNLPCICRKPPQGQFYLWWTHGTP